MRLLLDTHVFLWYILLDERLPDKTRTLLRDPANEVYLSVISTWEACVKYHLGKLPLPSEPAQFLPVQRVAHGINQLPLTERCLRHLQALPMIHKDPFDRMLICQAIENECSLVTDDSSIIQYDIPVMMLK